MQSCENQVIFSCRDEEGPIEIVDERTVRTLYFGTRARQSTMFLRDPSALALVYTHCMMASLLFVDQVRTALALGLGGGSLAKFLLRHFPASRVDGVEKREKVVEVAHAYFHLPEDPRLRIFVDQAGRFLQQASEKYDLVLVDIHDSQGIASEVGKPDFFPCCQQRLAARGVLAINLWVGNRRILMQQIRERLQTCFAGQVLYLPVAGKANTVALALNYPFPRGGLSALKPRAEELQAILRIDFPHLLAELVRYNPDWR